MAIVFVQEVVCWDRIVVMVYDVIASSRLWRHDVRVAPLPALWRRPEVGVAEEEDEAEKKEGDDDDEANDDWQVDDVMTAETTPTACCVSGIWNKQ